MDVPPFGKRRIRRWPGYLVVIVGAAGFWFHSGGHPIRLVSRAVDLWARQLLYGELTVAMVADSNRADVIVRWADSVPPAATPDPGPPVKACGGVTQGVLDATGQAFEGPFHTEISILTGTVFTPYAAAMRATSAAATGFGAARLRKWHATSRRTGRPSSLASEARRSVPTISTRAWRSTA